MSTSKQESLERVLADVENERSRQDEKWGEQNHSLPIWMLVLAEEVGEVNKDILEAWVAKTKGKAALRRKLIENARKELIQIAAVAVTAVEYIDRTSPHTEV